MGENQKNVLDLLKKRTRMSRQKSMSSGGEAGDGVATLQENVRDFISGAEIKEPELPVGSFQDIVLSLRSGKLQSKEAFEKVKKITCESYKTANAKVINQAKKYIDLVDSYLNPLKDAKSREDARIGGIPEHIFTAHDMGSQQKLKMQFQDWVEFLFLLSLASFLVFVECWATASVLISNFTNFAANQLAAFLFGILLSVASIATKYWVEKQSDQTKKIAGYLSLAGIGASVLVIITALIATQVLKLGSGDLFGDVDEAMTGSAIWEILAFSAFSLLAFSALQIISTALVQFWRMFGPLRERRALKNIEHQYVTQSIEGLTNQIADWETLKVDLSSIAQTYESTLELFQAASEAKFCGLIEEYDEIARIKQKEASWRKKGNGRMLTEV